MLPVSSSLFSQRSAKAAGEWEMEINVPSWLQSFPLLVCPGHPDPFLSPHFG
jgi:hypothetical protein